MDLEEIAKEWGIDENELFIRYADCNNVLQPSRESYDRVIGSGIFENDDAMLKIWHEVAYPETEFRGKNYDSIDEWIDAVRDFVASAKTKKHKKEVLSLVTKIEPYHVEEDPKLGLVLVADQNAVNVTFGGYTGGVPDVLPEHILTGEVIGENLMRDGLLLAKPKLIGKDPCEDL